MRSAGSMQTPPPTSTSALRRKVQKVQTVKLAKLSTANTRRMSSSVVERADTIDKAASKIEESPLQLPNLQFSPDEFSFPASGPATVPAYPQHKLFWDPDQGEEGMNIDFPTDDPFTFSGKPQKGLDPFVSSNAKSMVSQLPPSPSFDDFDTNTSQNVELSTIHGAADQSDFLPTSGLMISKGVNPSLLFSSPGCSSAPSVAVQLVQSDTLQPYANQIRDARIEKELSLDRKAKRRRKVQDDSPAVKAALQVLRDETDIHTEIEPPTLDVVVPHVHEARIRAGKATFTSAERNRREASTKKTQSIIHRHQSIQQSRKRTAVMLRIDKNGRAMTEARLVCDDEDSSHKSNPEVESLSDENESTSSSESDEMIISQPQSFAFPEPKTRKPKLARFATESKTHSQKSSYASTFASSNTTYTLPTSENPTGSRGTGTISSSKRRRGSHTKRRLHRTLSPTTMSDSIDGMRNDDRVVEVETETETTTSGDDNGGAQFELKKIVRNREQNNAMTRSGARNQTAGQRHVYTAFGDQIPANSYGKVMSTGQGRGLQMIDDISPTTVTDPELATPSSGRDSHASDSTRCICHASEVEGELMILWYVD